jgi:hypothetical protein
MVEYDNSCRIMIVDVNSVLYHILGRWDGHRSRCRSEVSCGGCQIFVKVEIVENDSNCQQV